MKTKAVVYKDDKFIDKNGVERPFTICAISVEMDESIEPCTKEIGEREYHGYKVTEEGKYLWLGISICHPSDISKYSKELAHQIAFGKATNERSRLPELFSKDSGYISKKLVNCLLEQEAEYFKKNPGKYIPGYNKIKKGVSVVEPEIKG